MPVLPLDWGVGEETVVERQAEPHADHVGLVLAARGADHALGYPVVRHHLFDRVKRHHGHAMLLRDLGHQVPAVGVENAAQPVRSTHQPGHLYAPHVDALGHLVRDEAAAMDDCRLALQRPGDDLLGVVKRHEIVDEPRALRAWRLQRIGPAARRHQQRVVAQWTALVQVDDPLFGIDPRHEGLGQQ